MTWKKIAAVVRRLRFVKQALQDQQSLSQLSRRYGMSRKSAYKWLARFEREGVRGLQDRSCQPHRSPRQISGEWVSRIRRLRRRYPTWGSRKLRARLRREYPRQGTPCARTIGNWLRRLKLIRRQTQRRVPRGPTVKSSALTLARRSNQVWTVDFKGWFRTADGQRVEPLTVRDGFSCYLLSVHLLGRQRWESVRRVFVRLFRAHGYPAVIRVDNGSPFGSTGPAGLTKLSAWWTALGIRVEFITPGHPQQNGAHEQMHGVLKKETTRPVSQHLRAQQRRLKRWQRIYNQIRPHERLKDRTPAEVYRSKPGRVRRPQVSYRRGWVVRRVRTNGEIRWQGRKRFIGEAFVGYGLGLQPAGPGQWKVYFANILLGVLRQADQSGLRPVRRVRLK